MQAVHFDPMHPQRHWLLVRTLPEDIVLGSVQSLGVIVFGTAVIIAMVVAALALWLAKGFTQPIIDLTGIAEQISTKDLPHLVEALGCMANGDLTARFDLDIQGTEITSRDEIGKLAAAFNAMISSLRDAGQEFQVMTTSLHSTISQVATNANSLSDASVQLTATATGADEGVSQIATTIQQVALGVGQNASSASRTSSLVEQVAQFIDSMAEGATQQSSSVATSSEITEEISSVIQQVANSARAGAEGAADVAEVARAGANIVDATVAGMKAIRGKVGLSA